MGEHLLNTAYAVPHLFGPMPASMETELARNLADRLKVQPEPILRKDSGSSDSQISFIRKADSFSSSSAGSSNPQQSRFRKPRRQAKWKNVKKNTQPFKPPKNVRCFTCALLRGTFPPRRPFFLFAGLPQSWRRLPRQKRTCSTIRRWSGPSTNH